VIEFWKSVPHRARPSRRVRQAWAVKWRRSMRIVDNCLFFLGVPVFIGLSVSHPGPPWRLVGLVGIVVYAVRSLWVFAGSRSKPRQ
jgi:hypothetical protein